LWAHYGGGHSGLCLGFDVSAMGFSEPDAREVEYVAAPRFRELFLSLVEELGEFVKPWEKGRTYPDEVGDAFYTRQIAKITHENLFVKSEKWKYEEEFRIVMDPSGLHSFDPRSLREIIFGTKTRDGDIKRVVDIVSASGWQHVNLKRVRHVPGSFEFEIAGSNVFRSSWVASQGGGGGSGHGPDGDGDPLQLYG